MAHDSPRFITVPSMKNRWVNQVIEMDGPLHVGVIDVLALAGFTPRHEGQEDPDGPIEGNAGKVYDIERDRPGTLFRADEAQNPCQRDVS